MAQRSVFCASQVSHAPGAWACLFDIAKKAREQAENDLEARIEREAIQAEARGEFKQKEENHEDIPFDTGATQGQASSARSEEQSVSRENDTGREPTSGRGGQEDARGTQVRESKPNQENPLDARLDKLVTALELTAQTTQELKARADAAEAEAKKERAAREKVEADAKAERERAEVAQRSAAAADNFQLGQSAEENLSGQGGLFANASKMVAPPAKDDVKRPKGDALFSRGGAAISDADTNLTVAFKLLAEGIAPIKWEEGNDAFNLDQMIRASVKSTFINLPKLKNFRYNFDAKRFEDGDGREFTNKQFDELASGIGARLARAGRSTLQRAVFANSVLSGKGQEVWDGLLAKLLRKPGESLDPALEHILYSKGPANAGFSTSDEQSFEPDDYLDGFIRPVHPVTDQDKEAALAARMQETGRWIGRPVLVYDSGDGVAVITGSHRTVTTTALYTAI
jgi:hypothetical protein